MFIFALCLVIIPNKLLNKQSIEQANDLITFNEHIESVFIEISKEHMNAKKNIVIGVIYRIPNTNMTDFNETMASALEQLRMENKLVY